MRLVFARFRQLASARQTYLSLAAEQVHFPRPSDGKKLVSFDWTPIRYRSVMGVLKNPFYAGAYIYGKTEKRGVRRGFLPRGLCNTCPDAARQRGRLRARSGVTQALTSAGIGG